MILAEYSGKEVDSMTAQLIAKGKNLAGKLGVGVDALLLGEGLEQQARELSGMGIERIFLMDDESLHPYNPQLYSQVIATFLKDISPSVFLLGYTYWGMVIGPAVATRLGARLFSNCLDVELTDDFVRVVRPMFRGIAFTRVEAINSAPVVVTLQKGTAPVKSASESQGEIVPVKVNVAESSLKVKALGLLAEVQGGVDLQKAELIVSAGRGIKEKANLKLIEGFAEALGGVVGCSRPVVDLGWLPLSYQVGISGKAVRPKIYIACGISGAVQHLTAILDSQMIIAINSDPKAPIFRVAKYGIVGDLFEVIPVIIKRAKELNVRAGSRSSQ